jgi:hypothetical protein
VHILIKMKMKKMKRTRKMEKEWTLTVWNTLLETKAHLL